MDRRTAGYDGEGHGGRWPPAARTIVHLAPGSTLPSDGKCAALLWVQQDATLIHNGREVDMHADDLAIINRTSPITSSGGGPSPIRVLELGPRHPTFQIENRSRGVTPLDGSDPLAGIIKRLWLVGQDLPVSDIDRDLVLSRLLDMIVVVVEHLWARRVDGSVSTYRGTMLDRADTIINAHLGDPEFCASELASRLRMSRRHLSSYYAAMGTTTTNAIMTQRLDRAKELLSDPASRNLQIASIASACGFADPAYFARCFRSRVGITPREFRDQAKTRTNRKLFLNNPENGTSLSA